MEISRRTLKFIRFIGATLLIGGGVLVAWTLYRFEALPNYLRIGGFVPFAFGVPMYSIDDYFDGWEKLDGREQGKAMAWLAAPFILLAGALWWYLQHPAAKA